MNEVTEDRILTELIELRREQNKALAAVARAFGATVNLDARRVEVARDDLRARIVAEAGGTVAVTATAKVSVTVARGGLSAAQAAALLRQLAQGVMP